MCSIEKKSGITLIALIITIIILVILAAVSINAAYNSGIVNYAVNGTQNYIEAAKKEEGYIENANNVMQSVMNRVDGLPVTTYTQPYFPSEDFKRVEGTYLANGLVIEDTSTEGAGNQFVWVVVPNDGSGPDYTDLPAADDEGYYTAIETALKNYASPYKSNSYQDVWYNGCGLVDETAYNTLKNTMLSSVYTHGGFWIGRYETGIAYTDTNGFRSAASAETPQTAVITKDAYPYNYVTCSQAQALASGVYSGTCTSSLMFGIQWNLVLKYLETKANWASTGGYTAVDYLKKGSGWDESSHGPGSTSWGNYKDSSFTITGENAKRSDDNGTTYKSNGDNGYSNTKEADSEVLLTTGANEKINSKMNICDLAGNVYELLLESSKTETTLPCTSRGGSFDVLGWEKSTNGRSINSIQFSQQNIGFRVTLF